LAAALSRGTLSVRDAPSTCALRIMLSRTEPRSYVNVWSNPLDKRLPVVPIPLTRSCLELCG